VEHDEALLEAAGVLAQVVIPLEVPLQVGIVPIVPVVCACVCTCPVVCGSIDRLKSVWLVGRVESIETDRDEEETSKEER